MFTHGPLKDRLACRLLGILIAIGLCATGALLGGPSMGCHAGTPASEEEAEEEPATSPLEISSTSFSDVNAALSIDPRGWLVFDFNFPIDPDSAKTHFSIVSQDAGVSASVAAFEGSDERCTMNVINDGMTVIASCPMTYCTNYEAVFDAGLSATSGEVLPDAQSFDFRTSNNPTGVFDGCRSDLLISNELVPNNAGGQGVFYLAGYDDIVPGSLLEAPTQIDIAKGPPSDWVFPEGGPKVLTDISASLSIPSPPAPEGIDVDPGVIITPGAAGIGISPVILGDVSGDGYADFAVGSNSNIGLMTLLGAGRSLLVWCDADALEPNTTIDFPSDFAIPFAVGDVNGDGLADMVVNRMGEGYVQNFDIFLGSPDCIGSEASATFQLNEGDHGLIVEPLKDFNGDGIRDFAIGSFNENYTSRAYVFLGSSEVSALIKPDLIFESSQPGDLFGMVATGGGDVNGDGVDDMLVGAPGGYGMSGLVALNTFMQTGGLGKIGTVEIPASAQEGRAYLFYGSKDYADADSPSTINRETADVTFQGPPTQALHGLGYLFGFMVEQVMLGGMQVGLSSVEGIPDEFGWTGLIAKVDGDSNSDIIIGAPFSVQMTNELTFLEIIMGGLNDIDALWAYVDGMGAAYIFKGGEDLPATVSYEDADSIIYGRNGVYGLGARIRPAYDINNDGNDDFRLFGAALNIDWMGADATAVSVDGIFFGDEEITSFNKDIHNSLATPVMDYGSLFDYLPILIMR